MPCQPPSSALHLPAAGFDGASAGSEMSTAGTGTGSAAAKREYSTMPSVAAPTTPSATAIPTPRCECATSGIGGDAATRCTDLVTSQRQYLQRLAIGWIWVPQLGHATNVVAMFVGVSRHLHPFQGICSP